MVRHLFGMYTQHDIRLWSLNAYFVHMKLHCFTWKLECVTDKLYTAFTFEHLNSV